MTEAIDWARSLGLNEDGSTHLADSEHLHSLIALKLAAADLPVPKGINADIVQDAADLLALHRQQQRMLQETHSPIDQRIQHFIDSELKDLGETIPQLPKPLELDHHGLSRELSIPFNKNEYHSQRVSSYRLDNGVLHNPINDRRTTKGVFHIAEGGLPIPADKKAVPLRCFARLLQAAFNAPDEHTLLPFTAGSENPAHAFAGIMLRPVICPEIPGHSDQKSMEIRFLAPGSLVCNLDFVESIFGNAGNPNLPAKDSALDCNHWSGHTGCVILATHLCSLTKKELGLPQLRDATEAQIRDGMCWEKPDELYNDGSPFKICHRTIDGVMITIIADNYFGYCKKEVKTQIGFAANLYGVCEEEHAGGAIAFPRYSLGHYFNSSSSHVWTGQHNMRKNAELFHDLMDFQPEGYGIDRTYNNIYYVPENSEFSLPKQNVSWTDENDEEFSLTLQPQNTYILPSGYKVRMERHPGAPSWRLIGTSPEGTFCHKPCTVSGGGKSEISKNIDDAIIYGPIYVSDYDNDFQLVQDIFDTDYSSRFNTNNTADYSKKSTRSVLSLDRSVGSVIKLLTPSEEEYTAVYNQWLESIPNHIKALVFIIKRFYDPDWNDNWQAHFGVDVIDGRPGHELKYQNRKLIGSYLRVGIRGDGSWCTFKLRQDYLPAAKVQMEDDITASCIVPRAWINGPHSDTVNPSIKITTNCEFRLFQRPDEAINRGFDKQTEYDMAQDGLFSSNYQALDRQRLQAMTQKVLAFEQFSQPMQNHLRTLAHDTKNFAVSSAHPRMIDGKASKNPRYLQLRPDIARSQERYLADISTRLARQLPLNKPLSWAVNAVITGRRNNPAEEGIRPLAVYNPIHYQELPELFMDFICSLTGKSPSTTGAGSEGALTKAPFNALHATTDLNNALIGMIVCGYDGFSSAAGHIGPQHRVDHDISLLIPEIWSRIPIKERSASDFIKNNLLEKIDDFEHNGETILASRLGFRITSNFVRRFFGKIFDNPAAVFAETLLRPETQDLQEFVDGVQNITENQARVAKQYFTDGSIDNACPPLKAILHIMVDGNYQGKTLSDPAIRELFTLDTVLASDWYQSRLVCKQQRDIALWTRHHKAVKACLFGAGNDYHIQKMDLEQRYADAQEQLAKVSSASYLESLIGTIGADPICQEHAP